MVYILCTGRIFLKTRVQLQAARLDMKYSTKGGKHWHCAERRSSLVDKAFLVGRLDREDDT